MKNDLLSIGEVSKMRDVGIKSLRYYERIGALKPAYVNPESGYRYYSMNQTVDLDIIKTCIELGIPLKDLTAYMTDAGTLDLISLMERGRAMAQERINEANRLLIQMDTYLEEIDAQKTFAVQKTPYRRNQPERFALCLPWKPSVERAARRGKGEADAANRTVAAGFDSRRYAKAMTELYALAEELGVVALYMQGLVHDPGKKLSTNHQHEWLSYLEIKPLPGRTLSPKALAARARENGACFVRIPSASFDGWRVHAHGFGESFERAIALMREKQHNEGLSIITEIWDTELDPNSYVVELLTQRG